MLEIMGVRRTIESNEGRYSPRLSEPVRGSGAGIEIDTRSFSGCGCIYTTLRQGKNAGDFRGKNKRNEFSRL